MVKLNVDLHPPVLEVLGIEGGFTQFASFVLFDEDERVTRSVKAFVCTQTGASAKRNLDSRYLR